MFSGRDVSPLLESKKYDKVYIMLGINEMGYPIEPLQSKYAELVSTIREKQPDATIYILANLHIKHVRSQNDSTFKNEKLNQINAMQASFADGVKIKYLDVNVIFDDENKALGAGYASDDFHPYAKYYLQWSQWLAINSKSPQKAVASQQPFDMCDIMRGLSSIIQFAIFLAT